MAKKANPAVVGGFVVGAAALAVVGVLVFGKGDLFQEEFRYVAHFDSSVAGLDIGAPIRFKGVQVGSVSDVRAVWNVDQESIRIPVELTFVSGAIEAPSAAVAASLEETSPYEVMSRLIERGLRAELGQDSFVTGKLHVALEFYPGTEVRLLGGSSMPEIPTTEAGLAKLAKSLEELPVGELLERANSTLAALESLLANPQIEEAVQNLNRLMASVEGEVQPLSESARATLEDLRSLLANVDGEVQPLAQAAQGTLEELRSVLRQVDEELGPLAESTRTTLDQAREFLADADGQLAGVSADLRVLLQDVDAQVEPLSASTVAALDEARGTLGRLNEVLGEGGALNYRTIGLLEELTEAARAVRLLAAFLERHPEAFLSGKQGR